MVILVLHDGAGHADRTGGKVDIVPCNREKLGPSERVQREQDRERGRRAYSGGDELRYLLRLKPLPHVRV